MNPAGQIHLPTAGQNSLAVDMKRLSHDNRSITNAGREHLTWRQNGARLFLSEINCGGPDWATNIAIHTVALAATHRLTRNG